MSAYKWKTGAVVKTNADVAGKQFEQLEKTVGLTPQTVLDANRAENAPLHNEFEWNDEQAAELYRLRQAGYLIRSISVIVQTQQNEEKEVRAFFQTEYKGEYESISVIFDDENKHDALLEKALKELEAFSRKYETLVELKPIRTAMKKIKEKALA